MLLHIPDVLTADQVARGATPARRRRLGRRPRHRRPPVGAGQGQPAAARGSPGRPGARRPDSPGAAAQRRCSSRPRCRCACSRRSSTATRADMRSATTSTTRSARSPGTPHRIRTDLSATLFFSEPDEYDGGELVVEDTYGAHSVKLPAGPHGALPVDQPASRAAGDARRADRLVLLDSEHGPRRRQRTLLFDLDTRDPARRARPAGSSRRRSQLTGVYHNLLRAWAEL